MNKMFHKICFISMLSIFFIFSVIQVLAVSQFSDDEFSTDQYYIGSLRIDDVWITSLYNREKVTVAIIDDGIYQNHPDLGGMLWTNEDEIAGNGIDDDNNGYVDDFLGYDFLNDTNEMTHMGTHGTVVAGIIGAIRDNGEGIAGITEYATMMPLIVCSDIGCATDDIIEAIYYAVNNGAQIINLSLGGVFTNGYTDNYNEVIEYAYDNNVVIIVASGNGDLDGGIGYDLDAIPQSPVCNDNNSNMVLGVGAMTSDLKHVGWANYGECVDLFAPGENILSTHAPAAEEDTLYLYEEGLSGTSFAAPIVTGLAVEILSSYHSMSNEALYDYMIDVNDSRGHIDGKTLINDIKKNHNDPNYDSSQDWFTGSYSFNKNPYLSEEIIDDEKDSIFEKDVEQSQFKDAIIALKNRDVINGYPDGTFKHLNPINRAEFMKIAIGAAEIEPAGENCFLDVGEEWFAPYVCAGMAHGIINGYSDGSFKPNQQINVVEALKITLKAFGVQTREANSEEAWYAPFTEYAQSNGYYLDTFDSDSKQITREDMAELVYRLMPSI